MRYFDLHCDTLTVCLETGQGIENNNLQLSLKGGSCFEKWRQCFAVWFPDGMTDERAVQTLDGCKALFGDAGETGILTLENAFIASGEEYSPEILKKRYGVSMLSLTWNAAGRLCGGCMSGGGLTRSGRRVIRQCERAGIAVDVSHISDEGFDEVLSLTDAPVAASHSNCRELCNVPRNLTDRQIKRIIDASGIIGLCFYPKFLGAGGVFEGIYKNIRHILSLGGEKAVAVGSDFDGAQMDESLSGLPAVPNLYAYLEKKGLDAGLLDMFFYQNAENFFKRFYI